MTNNITIRGREGEEIQNGFPVAGLPVVWFRSFGLVLAVSEWMKAAPNDFTDEPFKRQSRKFATSIIAE